MGAWRSRPPVTGWRSTCCLCQTICAKWVTAFWEARVPGEPGSLSPGAGFLLVGAPCRYAASLRRLVEALCPQVVHSNSLKFHLLSSLARLPVPIVWHLHDFLGSRVVMARVLRWCCRMVAGAVAVSQAVARDAQTVLRRAPIAVVPNAVDTDHFCPGQAERPLDELAGLAPLPGELRVGLVATYATWKGQDVFLEAAEQVARELPDLPLRFFIVGGPIYQTRGSQWSEGELRTLRCGTSGPGTGGVYRLSVRSGPGLPGARSGRACQHASRAVRSHDRRGHGLRPACYRLGGGRRRGTVHSRPRRSWLASWRRQTVGPDHGRTDRRCAAPLAPWRERQAHRRGTLQPAAVGG